MSTGSIDRVQSDLNAMREVLGLGPIWSMTDVRFGFTLAGSCALLALFRWPGSPLSVPMPWAAVPVLATIAACIGYMVIKWRTLPRREAARRREYRFAVVAIVCFLTAYFGYQYWARHVGLTIAQQGGVLLAFVGTATIIFAIAQPAPRRYPRSYSFTCGLPLVLLGLALPLVPSGYSHSLIGLMGFTAFGVGSLVMRHYLQAALAEENARVLD